MKTLPVVLRYFIFVLGLFSTVVLWATPPDADGDDLSDSAETTLGTDPDDPDTDGDNLGDGMEVTLGTDPLVADADDVPNQISGRRLHLKADAGVTLDGSGNVSTWSDQSGNANDATQATSGIRPPLVTNELNSKPVLRFSGGQSLRLPDTMETGLTAVETFLVLKGTEAQSGSYKPFDFGGEVTGIYALLYPTNGQIRDDTGNTISRTMGNPNLPLDQWRVYHAVSESGNFTAWLDAGLLHQSFTNTVNFRSTGFYVGQGVDGYPFVGDIAEIIVYDHALTPFEREAISRYLSAKYALGMTSAATPTALTGHAVSATQAHLSWTPGAAGVGVTYRVERRAGSGDYELAADLADSSGCFDTNLTAATTYTYRVRARTPSGFSAYSSEVSVTTLAASTTDLPTTALRLWLRADTGLVRGNLERVILWPDQSGQHNDAVLYMATAQQPLWAASAINGRPAVRFDGTDDYLQFPDTMETGLTAVETFLVLKGTEEQSVNRKPFDFGGGTSGIWALLYATLGEIRDDTGSTVSHILGNPALPLDQWRVYNATAAPGEWTGRLDGSVIYQTFTNTVNFRTSGFFLGKGVDGYPFNGDIAEVLVFDRPLSPQQREIVTRHLALKYGLVSGYADRASVDGNLDGLADGVGTQLGIDADDLDSDDDTVANATELANGTDPIRADTDGDTVDDDTDAFPLDPTRTTAPTPGPGDTTPPVITLTKPTNATPNP